ncbi:MAG: YfhO family protein, partial [Acidimicrobiales bacterium]
LVVSSNFVWSSSPTYLTTTPAEAELQRTVGSAVVGLGPGACLAPPGLGILPNVNVMFGVRQMAVYDPMLPKTYFTAWNAAAHQSGGLPQISTFCPSVTSATLARRFGIGYVLTARGATGPAGGRFVKVLGSGPAAEDLYKIPGVAAATLTPASHTGAPLGTDEIGTPVAVTHPTSASWNLTTDSASPAVLRLHLTNSPGWHGTIDGKPLALGAYSGVMLEARIPPGRHHIVVRYWPDSFTLGIILALCGALGLAVANVIERVRTGPKRHPHCEAPAP